MRGWQGVEDFHHGYYPLVEGRRALLELADFERRTERGPVAFTRPDPPSMTPGPVTVAHGPVARTGDKEQPTQPKPPQRSPTKRRRT
jgi:hypothetical protein